MPQFPLAFACRPAPTPLLPVPKSGIRTVRAFCDVANRPVQECVLRAFRALFPVDGLGDAALWRHVSRNFSEFGVLVDEHQTPAGLIGFKDVVVDGRPALLIGALGIVKEYRGRAAKPYSDVVRAAILDRLRGSRPPEVLVGATFHPGHWDVAAVVPPRSVPFEASPDWSRAASCVFALPATSGHILGAAWRSMRVALSVPCPEDVVEPENAFGLDALDSLTLELECLGVSATGPIATVEPRLARYDAAEG
jgi:hypothetical protein